MVVRQKRVVLGKIVGVGRDHSGLRQGRNFFFFFLSLFSLLARRRVRNNIAGADVFIVVRTYIRLGKSTSFPFNHFPTSSFNGHAYISALGHFIQNYFIDYRQLYFPIAA